LFLVFYLTVRDDTVRLAMRVTGWILAGLAWAFAVVGGFAILLKFKTGAGRAESAPASWPATTALARAADRATLLMFLHPHCVCSRASLAELGRMLPRVRERVATRVVMVRPDGTAPGWEQSGLRDAALATPGVTVVEDVGGAEAARFGAATSGACVLYDRDGRLLFTGGITALRGHEGESFGQERIVSLLTSGAADRHDSPVFGCELENPPDHPAQRGTHGR
jgi:hypothetical protein